MAALLHEDHGFPHLTMCIEYLHDDLRCLMLVLWYMMSFLYISDHSYALIFNVKP